MDSKEPIAEEEKKTKERFIKELSEYERRFTSMLANVHLCSVMLDRDQTIIFINNYLLEQAGYTQEEVIYKGWVELFIPEEKREQVKNIYSMIFAGLAEVLCYIESEIITKDGRRILVGWNNTLLRDVNNNVVGVSSIGEDLCPKGTDVIPLSASSSEGDVPKLSVSGNNFTGETLGEYILVKPLGGENSNVKLAIHKVTKQKVAVKTLKKQPMTEQELERARREIDIMQKLTKCNNPYIIKLLDFVETPEEFHIFLEYISGGELVAFILSNKGLTEVHTHRLFLQILSAIETCHNHNIIHRDIKLQNILLDHNNNIKLIDFGLSNFTQEGVFRNTFCGTPAYASPEILLGKNYTGPEVDLWSLGVVLYSMLTAKFPFTTIADILRGKFKDPEGVSSECIDLLTRLLKVEKEDRENLAGVLKHPWINMSDEEIEALSISIRHQLDNNTAEVGGKEIPEILEETEDPSPKRRKTASAELLNGKSG